MSCMHTPHLLLPFLLDNVWCPLSIPSHKETFLTFTWHQGSFWHKARPLLSYSIPLTLNAIIHEVDCQIDLKIMTAKVFVFILLPMFGSHSCFTQGTNNNMWSVNHSVQCPAEDLDVIAICANCHLVIRTIMVISINGFEVFNVVCLSKWWSIQGILGRFDTWCIPSRDSKRRECWGRQWRHCHRDAPRFLFCDTSLDTDCKYGLDENDLLSHYEFLGCAFGKAVYGESLSLSFCTTWLFITQLICRA